MATFKYKNRYFFTTELPFNSTTLRLFIPDLLSSSVTRETLEDMRNRFEFSFPAGEKDGVPELPISGFVFYDEDPNDDIMNELLALEQKLVEYYKDIYLPNLTAAQVLAKRLNIAVKEKVIEKPKEEVVEEEKPPFPIDLTPEQPPKEKGRDLVKYHGLSVYVPVLEASARLIHMCNQCYGKVDETGKPIQLCGFCERNLFLDAGKRQIMGDKQLKSQDTMVMIPPIFHTFYRYIFPFDTVLSRGRLVVGYLTLVEIIERISNPNDRAIMPFSVEENKEWYEKAQADREKVYKQIRDYDAVYEKASKKAKTFLERFQALEKMVFDKYLMMAETLTINDPFVLLPYKGDYEKLKTVHLLSALEKGWPNEYTKEFYYKSKGVKMEVKLEKSQVPTAVTEKEELPKIAITKVVPVTGKEEAPQQEQS